MLEYDYFLRFKNILHTCACFTNVHMYTQVLSIECLLNIWLKKSFVIYSSSDIIAVAFPGSKQTCKPDCKHISKLKYPVRLKYICAC